MPSDTFTFKQMDAIVERSPVCLIDGRPALINANGTRLVFAFYYLTFPNQLPDYVICNTAPSVFRIRCLGGFVC